MNDKKEKWRIKRKESEKMGREKTRNSKREEAKEKNGRGREIEELERTEVDRKERGK